MAPARRRSSAVRRGLAAALLALAQAGAAQAEDVEAWTRKAVESWRAKFHLGPGVADAGALAAEAKRAPRRARGTRASPAGSRTS